MLLPSLIDSFTSLICNVAEQAISFLTEHTWLLVLAVVAFLMEKVTQRRLSDSATITMPLLPRPIPAVYYGQHIFSYKISSHPYLHVQTYHGINFTCEEKNMKGFQMFHTGRDCVACQPLLFPNTKIRHRIVSNLQCGWSCQAIFDIWDNFERVV